MSKSLATRLKETLADLITYQQTAYVGEGVRVLSDILEIRNIFNFRGYIATGDIDKAFDPSSHYFSLACLKKNWI